MTCQCDGDVHNFNATVQSGTVQKGGHVSKRTVARAERLVRIVEKLRLQDSSATELLSRLGLDKKQLRSVQRDLELLLLRGDIQQKPDGLRYTAPNQPPIRLNAVEAVAMYSAARLLFHHASEYNEHYRSALEKLGAILPGPTRALVQATNAAYARRPNAKQSQAAELVARAWLEGKWLAFDYASAGGSRAPRRVELATYFVEINPQNRAAYAIGLDRTGNHSEPRVFKVSRMRNPHLMDDAYVVPDVFDPMVYISSAWGIMSGVPVEVELRFSPLVAERILEEHWPQTRLCERLEDGGVRLVLAVGGTLELKPWILGWGSTVEVVSPKNLRLEIAQEAWKMASRYNLGGLT